MPKPARPSQNGYTGALQLTRVPKARLEYLENGALVMELRKGGYAVPDIAQELGLEMSTVRRLLARARKDGNSNRYAAEILDIENARLDEITRTLWPGIMSGDGRSIDRYFTVCRLRLQLNGLSGGVGAQGKRDPTAPSKGPYLLEVVDSDATEAEPAEAGDEEAPPAPDAGVAEQA